MKSSPMAKCGLVAGLALLLAAAACGGSEKGAAGDPAQGENEEAVTAPYSSGSCSCDALHSKWCYAYGYWSFVCSSYGNPICGC